MSGQEYWNYWEKCIKYLEEKNTSEITAFSKKLAKDFGVSDELMEKIFAVNLKSYSNKIDVYMQQCIERAKRESAKALCLYYDIDNGWDSTIYICKDFCRDSNKWISSKSRIEIGKARGFSGIYKKEAHAVFFADGISTGICILLMVRTTLAFKDVVEKYKDC
ncbi:hypothetical protein [Treponema pedis]|uniref:Uncharacterized protein n=1 Tax=Treponema pedis str. T A4 TaxID=1291379 RepID=S6A581_9SPIR|nr:hypothetical protein [Treponema pedis]AGT45141.1 hypothetical protein TPE_2669 [Treponema pedis str. T A4]QSI05740.1 hypothetical protein DYQ05_12910 [Treponema pedis]